MYKINTSFISLGYLPCHYTLEDYYKKCITLGEDPKEHTLSVIPRGEKISFSLEYSTSEEQAKEVVTLALKWRRNTWRKRIEFCLELEKDLQRYKRILQEGKNSLFYAGRRHLEEGNKLVLNASKENILACNTFQETLSFVKIEKTKKGVLTERAIIRKILKIFEQKVKALTSYLPTSFRLEEKEINHITKILGE